jgi:beta-lactamase regulating signal transducer with metallopeptidase domain/ankyrin repeat protein
MNAFITLFSEPWMQRLGWVLIHFIWQGAGIALLLTIALRILGQASSEIRYTVIAFSLLVSAAMPAVTWTVLGSAAKPAMSLMTSTPGLVVPQIEASPGLVEGSPIETIQGASHAVKTSWQSDLVQITAETLPYVVGLWVAGVLILTSRLVLGWIWTQRLRRAGSSIRELECLERFRSLLKRMQVTVPVRLLQSAQVEVPTLIGWLRPTILIPVSILSGLSPDQLEAILAHELAHVRRYDYLVNLLQTVIETIFFYHPAIWWISRKLREERENCCDDVVLEVMQNRLVYASALALLEEARTTSFALSASGGSLLQRINRIAGLRAPRSSLLPVIFTALIIGLLAVPLIGQIANVKTTGGISKSLPRPLPPFPTAAEMKAMEDSKTPLMKALEQHKYDKARVLLSQGADVNAEDKMGNVALGFLMEWSEGRFPLDILKVLLEQGRNPNPPVHAEFSTLARPEPVLDVTVTDAEFSVGPDLADFRRAAQMLFEHGATFATTQGDEQTLLQASVRGDLGTVQQLIAKGVSLNAADANGWTPLMLSIAFDRTELTNWLLAGGANVNVPSRRGAEDPLTWAADRGNDDLVEELIARGAKANLAWLGLARSVDRNDQRMFDDLIKVGADPKQFARAWVGDSNDKPEWRQIVSDPLYKTIEKGQTSMALTLLDKGVDPEPADVENGKNYTYWAVYYDRPQILQSLLDHGANPLAKDNAGETPLSLAQKSHPDLVPMLQAAIAKSKDTTSVVSAQTSGTDNSVSQPPVGQVYKDFQFPFYQDGRLKFKLTAAAAKGITINRAETTDLKIDLYDNDKVTTTITSPKADLY